MLGSKARPSNNFLLSFRNCLASTLNFDVTADCLQRNSASSGFLKWRLLRAIGTTKRAEILEIGRVPSTRTFLTDLAIRDTGFITSLKMTAAGVMQFFIVDEKDKRQQSMTINDNGAIIFGHGITRELISIFLQRVALRVSTTACGLSSHGGRLKSSLARFLCPRTEAV